MIRLSALKKGGLLIALLLLFSIKLSANPFILEGYQVLDPRANEKIFQIGSEVKSKTGTSIYIYARANYNINDKLSKKEIISHLKAVDAQIVNKLKGSFVLITLAYTERHINIYTSNDLKSVINKNEILDEYMIPLLASYDKNTIPAKITASLFNGYSQIADVLAEHKNITLTSNIESTNKTMADIWKNIMYFIVISGLAAYFIAVRRQKKLGIK
jgi:hypothetical protein